MLFMIITKTVMKNVVHDYAKILMKNDLHDYYKKFYEECKVV